MALDAWFFELIMTTIYGFSSFVFISFGVKAVKLNDRIMMGLCLLLTFSSIMITLDNFWALSFTYDNNILNGGKSYQFWLSWTVWSDWIYYLCFPQACVLITYLLFRKVVSF